MQKANYQPPPPPPPPPPPEEPPPEEPPLLPLSLLGDDVDVELMEFIEEAKEPASKLEKSPVELLYQSGGCEMAFLNFLENAVESPAAKANAKV